MISANDIEQLQTETLEAMVLRAVAVNEPVKKHLIPNLLSPSLSRNEVFGCVLQMRKDGLLDVGGAEEGCIVMLTPEGRAAFQALKDSAPVLPEVAQAVTTHDGGRVGAESKSLSDRILGIVVDNPGISGKDLRAKLGIDESDTKARNSVLSLLSQLDLKRGKIHRKKNGIEVLLYPGKAPAEPPKEEPLPEKSPVPKRIETADQEKAAIKEARENGEVQILPTGGGEPAELDPSESTPFRVALTSDSTVILFGLQDQPLELDKTKSAVLVNFIKGTGGPIWPLP